jgi:hypothetical protein
LLGRCVDQLLDLLIQCANLARRTPAGRRRERHGWYRLIELSRNRSSYVNRFWCPHKRIGRKDDIDFLSGNDCLLCSVIFQRNLFYGIKLRKEYWLLKRVQFLLLCVELRQQRVLCLNGDVQLGLRQLLVLVGVKLRIQIVDLYALGLQLLCHGRVLRTNLLIGSAKRL